jgi:hypothetical protein
MQATRIELATGAAFEVAMSYEDARAYFAASGMRETLLADGRRKAIDSKLIVGFEELATKTTKNAIGFR